MGAPNATPPYDPITHAVQTNDRVFTAKGFVLLTLRKIRAAETARDWPQYVVLCRDLVKFNTELSDAVNDVLREFGSEIDP